MCISRAALLVRSTSPRERSSQLHVQSLSLLDELLSWLRAEGFTDYRSRLRVGASRDHFRFDPEADIEADAPPQCKSLSSPDMVGAPPLNLCALRRSLEILLCYKRRIAKDGGGRGRARYS